jgi:Tetratricopeptide repeat/TPR repeat
MTEQRHNGEEMTTAAEAFARYQVQVGLMLAAEGRTEEAMCCYRQAIQSDPHFALAHTRLGIALNQQNRLAESEGSFTAAVRLNPDDAEAFCNLGVAVQRRGRLHEAIGHCERALRLRPGFPEAHNNLGMALRHLAKWEEAEEHFEQALRLKPDYADPHYNLAFVWLTCGDFGQGWPEYEWRWAQPGFLRRAFQRPLWDGSDLRGRTILLYAEQGFGDTLHFIRYVQLIRQRGGTVIVECQRGLVSLLAGVAGISHLVSQGDLHPAFDVQSPLLSLPGIFQTCLENIPAAIPYVHPKPALVEHWRRAMSGVRTPNARQVFRVGIAWQGKPEFLHDCLRSIPLDYFTRLLEVEGVQLISLQLGLGGDDLRTLSGKVIDFGDRLDQKSGAFMDTAAIMMNLDLVISSDTAVCHLAGALGVPVWVALALAPDWRWLLDRTDSPWYPTMRLFRQSRQGDWDEIFERITSELKLATTSIRMEYG